MDNMESQLDNIIGTEAPSSVPESENNGNSNDFESSLNAFIENNGGEQNTEGTPITDPSQLKPNQILIGGQPFTIDDKFVGQDPLVAVQRTLQSKHDKLNNQFNQLNEQHSKLEQSDAFLTMLQTDKGVLKAFANKLYPDLFPKIDAKSYVQSKLNEEFGADFQYDPAEAENNPLSDHAEYKERIRELKAEAKKGGDLPQAFEEVMQNKIKEQEKLTQAKITAKNNLMQQTKMDETEYQTYGKWVNYLVSNEHILVKLFRTVNRKAQSSIPNAQFVSGSPVTNNIEAQLKSLFGPATRR